jgi:hypothetical protein
MIDRTIKTIPERKKRKTTTSSKKNILEEKTLFSNDDNNETNNNEPIIEKKSKKITIQNEKEIILNTDEKNYIFEESEFSSSVSKEKQVQGVLQFEGLEKYKAHIYNKIVNSNHTVDLLRVSPFAPVEKVSHNSKILKTFRTSKGIMTKETPWGIIEYRSRQPLTQSHKDIFDCIMVSDKEQIKILPTGNIAIYFSLYELSQKLGIGWGSSTKKNLEEKLNELRDTTIKYGDKKGGSVDFNLFSHIGYSSNYDTYGVVLDPVYVDFFSKHLTIEYRETLLKKIKISGSGSSLIKAMIDFLITHDTRENPYKISLFKLLDTIGYDIETPNDKKVVKSTLKKYEETLKDFNIYYHPTMEEIEFFGNKKIKFITPILPLFQ